MAKIIKRTIKDKVSKVRRDPPWYETVTEFIEIEIEAFFCSNCDGRVDSHDSYCRHCGAKFAEK